ncbi:MAG: hypothetical protein HYY93_12080 [Planctomycetes bacterium]|nr:hypothetical protein [Planctomycetota bacterium]
MKFQLRTVHLLWFFLLGGITFGLAAFVYRGEYVQSYANKIHLSRYPGIEKSKGKLPAYVLSVSGTVQYQPPGSNEWITVSADTVILEGAKVRTLEGGEVVLATEGSAGEEGKDSVQSTISVSGDSELSLMSKEGKGKEFQAAVSKGAVSSTTVKQTKEGKEVEVTAVAAGKGGEARKESKSVGTSAEGEGEGAEKQGAALTLLFDQSPLSGGDDASMVTVRFKIATPSEGAVAGLDRPAMRRMVMEAINRYIRGVDQGRVGALSRLLLDPIDQDRAGLGLAALRASVTSADLTFRYMSGGSQGGSQGGGVIDSYVVRIEREDNQWKVMRKK